MRCYNRDKLDSLAIIEHNLYEFPPADIEQRNPVFRAPDFVITKNSIYNDLPNWACVA